MFEGFSGRTVDFLWGIRFNNERDWFEANKRSYLNDLQRPMKALAQDVYDTVRKASPGRDLTCRVSRIYRDARRLRGRGPYKDGLWFTLERSKENWTQEPVFWFELKPEGYTYGMGFYAAPPLTMAKLRARIDRDPKPMEKLVRDFQKQSVFTLDGENYRRPKGNPSPLLAPWYQKKSFSLLCTRTQDELLFRRELLDHVSEGFSFLMPYYDYIIRLEGDPDPRLPKEPHE